LLWEGLERWIDRFIDSFHGIFGYYNSIPVVQNLRDAFKPEELSNNKKYEWILPDYIRDKVVVCKKYEQSLLDQYEVSRLLYSMHFNGWLLMVYDIIDEILDANKLFPKEYILKWLDYIQNKRSELWQAWLDHEKQKPDVLKGSEYWNLHNLRNMIFISQKVQAQKWNLDNIKTIWFAAWWSFWPIYLSTLFKLDNIGKYKQWECELNDNQDFPDIIFWSSAWSSYIK